MQVHSDFRQEEAVTLLQKLHDYIRDCEAIVCIVGKRSVARPTEREAAPFRDMLPGGMTSYKRPGGLYWDFKTNRWAWS